MGRVAALRLTSSSDRLGSCVPVDLFQSPSCSPRVPHFFFFFLPISLLLLLRKRACPHLNSAKGDGLKMRSADSGAWLQMTVNYSVGDSGWRLVVPRPEEEENKERRDGKGYIISWHQLSSLWLWCVFVHTYTHLCVSLAPFPPPYRLLSLPQMWEMKRIGGVMFKCGNALAKSATSINTATCVQYTWVCMHEHARTHTHTHIHKRGVNITPRCCSCWK